MLQSGKLARLVILVFVLVALFAIVPAASACPEVGAPVAQDPAPGTPQDLVTVLTNMARSVGVGVVISFLFKKPGWFQHLADEVKWWIIFGISIGLPPLAQLLIDLVPSHLWQILNPYWLALSFGFITWAASQAVFEGYIKPNRTYDDSVTAG